MNKPYIKYLVVNRTNKDKWTFYNFDTPGPERINAFIEYVVNDKMTHNDYEDTQKEKNLLAGDFVITELNETGVIVNNWVGHAPLER